MVRDLRFMAKAAKWSRLFQVVLGGGRHGFLPRTVSDPESGKGHRRDGKNLIETWATANPEGSYVTSRDQLLQLNLTNTDKLLGTHTHAQDNRK